MREQIKTILPKAGGSTKNALQTFDDKVSAILNGPTKPAPGSKTPTLSHVNDTANTLYGDVDRADAAPTEVQMTMTESAESDAQELFKSWQEIKDASLPAINAQLRRVHLPQIDPQQKNETDAGPRDEE